MREEPFVLRVEGLDLMGTLYLPAGAGQRHGLIVSHGIPAGPPEPGDPGYPALAQRFCGQGFLTAIFNFRGCGRSGGDFEIRGWTRDLAAVADHLWGRPELDHGRLTLMGFSAGAAVSVYLGATDERVTSVIACSCPSAFEGFREEAATRQFLARARQVGIIREEGYPSSVEEWMAGFQEVAPLRWVAGIAPRPLLLLHGSEDDVVPVKQAWELYRAAGDPKELRIIRGAGHRLRQKEEAVSSALEWLERQGAFRPKGAEFAR